MALEREEAAIAQALYTAATQAADGTARVPRPSSSSSSTKTPRYMPLADSESAALEKEFGTPRSRS
jgi:hypothetical protein